MKKGAVTTSELECDPRSSDYDAEDGSDHKLTAASKYANERRNYEMDDDDD